jgi:hypothetical protein
MPKGKQKLSSIQRQARVYQIVFVIISIIVLLTMILALVR